MQNSCQCFCLKLASLLNSHTVERVKLRGRRQSTFFNSFEHHKKPCLRLSAFSVGAYNKVEKRRLGPDIVPKFAREMFCRMMDRIHTDGVIAKPDNE